MKPHERIVLALDVDTREEALELVHNLRTMWEYLSRYAVI